MRVTSRQVVSSFAASLRSEIRSLPTRRLRSVLRTCESFTRTNCGWTSYVIAPAVIRFAGDELEWRRRHHKPTPAPEREASR